MNVMVVNKFKDLILSLNIDVMKTMEGVFNVDEIIDTFANFYYDKMILDITAIRDYQNIDNLQKLAMNINMENVVILLDNTPATSSKAYLSKLISLGIYNFTNNTDGINYLLVHPHSYKDVVNIHNLTELNEASMPASAGVMQVSSEGRLKVIGFKNVTNHAGATSLIYMVKKALMGSRSVCAIEINKVDFQYFNDKDMVSTTANDFPLELMKRQGYDVVLVDLNNYEQLEVCKEVLYLMEASTLMLNKLLRINKNALNELRDKKVILNRCCLSPEDVSTFEFETKIRPFMTIPALDDRSDDIQEIRRLVESLYL